MPSPVDVETWLAQSVLSPSDCTVLLSKYSRVVGVENVPESTFEEVKALSGLIFWWGRLRLRNVRLTGGFNAALS